MKKILLFLSFLLMSIGVWGDSYTITFDGANSESTGIFTSTTAASITSSSSYVTGNVAAATKAYGATSSGIKLGTSSAAGSIKINLSTSGQVTPMSIVVNCKLYNSNKAATLGVNGSTKQSVGSNYGDLTFNITSAITYIQIDVTKYVWVKSITVNYSTTSYTITAQSNNTDYGTVSLSGSVITGLPADSCIYASPAYTITSGTATVSQSENTFTVTPSSDCTVRINFERIPTYTVTYNLNGGTGIIPTEKPQMEGSAFTLHDGTTGIEPPTGKEFSKWNDGINNYKGGASYTMPGNNITLTAQWKDKLVVDGMKFILLSDIDDLEDGDSIIIVNGDSITMSIEQASNNRRSTTKFNYDERNNIITLTDESDSVQIIKITKIDDYWGLETDSGYLYAAGNGKSSNYLRTQETNDANGYWDITINEECIASVVAQGANSNNTMQYNQNKGGTNGPLFSCYSSASQSPIKIYKKIKDLYTVVFKNNGIAIDTIYTIKHLSTIPSVSSNTLRCQTSGVFVGWSGHDIITTNTEPDDLFQTLKGSPVIESDKTFYAVFANEIPQESHTGNFELTIDVSDFKGGGYAANEGYKVSVATSTNNDYPDDTAHVEWFSYNVMKSGGMQWRQSSLGAGYIYNTTNLQNIISLELSDVTGTFTKYYGTSEHPLSSTSIGTNKGYFCILNGSKTGNTSKITVNFSKTVVPKLYSGYTTYCIDTLHIEGNWNNSGNWKHGRVPEFNEAAVLLKSATVNIPHAFAKYVIIDKSSTNTGKLTIGANQGLEVQDTVSVYDGTYKATTPSDLVLESSSAGNASLIFNNNNENQATVCLYSQAYIDRNVTPNKWNWQYMGTAMTSLNALYNYYGSWVYRWDGEQQKWAGVPNGGTMTAWTGYCITQESPEWYATTGTLVETDTRDITLSVPANKNMVFANSWTAPIHVSKFTNETFALDTMNVYLFNTGSDPDGTGAIIKNEVEIEPGTYIVMPVHSSPYTGDSLIAPQQGFYVTTGKNNGTITLKYKDLVRTNGSESIVAGTMRAPKRTIVSDKPDVMKIYVNGSKYGDKVVILEKEDFSVGFDNGWDGKKMSFGDESPSIYVVNENGTYDAVSAIPDYEGVVLGFKSGSDSICKISFEYGGDNEWYLNDLATLTSTLISGDNEYVFIADSTNDVRFIISETPYADVATDINNTSDVSNKIQKYLYHGNLYIIKNNRIFNTIGSLIK